MFELIICTYNRRKLALNLAMEALSCTPAPDKVVIVDSSDDFDAAFYTGSSSLIEPVHSSHKNQPYQRYLGFLTSSAAHLVYFDDDIKIKDRNIFEYLTDPLKRNEVVGACVKVRYENVLHKLLDKPKVNQGLLSKLINVVSGVPSPSAGRLGLVGVPGEIPDRDGPIEFFQGTNMAFRRDILEKAFDHRVYSQYECHLGKGEDKIISFKTASSGTLWYTDKEALHHPPVETSYFGHSLAFSRRLAYSRYFLSMVWCEERNFPKGIGALHYYYFMSWRVILAALAYLRTRKPAQAEAVKGLWKGMVLTFEGSSAYNSCHLDWEKEARKDIEGR
ncbi:MAG: glycosyltransferase [Cyclobacteriaceae bacterium]